MLGREAADLRKLLDQLGSFYAFAAALGVMVLVSAATVVGEAWLLRRVINLLLARKTSLFLSFGLAYIGICVIDTVFVGWWRAQRVRYSAELAKNLRGTLVGSLLRSRAESRIKKPGEMASRTTSDIENAQEVVTPLYKLLKGVTSGLAASIYIIYLDWRLGVLIIVTVPLVTATGEKLSRPIASLAEEVQQGYADVSEFASDYLANHSVVRTFGLQKRLYRRFNRLNEHVLQRNLQMKRREALLSAGIWFCAAAPVAIPFVYGAYLVMVGEVTAGTIMAVVYLTNYTRAPLASLGDHMGKIRRCLGSAREVMRTIEGVRDRSPSTTGSGGEAFPVAQKKGIEVQKVSFRYPGTQSPALQEVSLTLHRGTDAFIVGPSGSGKTTLLRILGGIAAPDEGAVTVDGRDPFCRPDQQPDRRPLAVYVPQQPYLFPWTIRENLQLAKRQISAELMEKVLRTARAEFVLELSDGLDTELSERGESLSGGQRARLCIARALLLQPRLLILDEPSASLDALTERALWRQLRSTELCRQVVAVTHRLSEIEDSDRVIVMEEGWIREQGPHEQLYRNSPLYRSYYRKYSEERRESR